MLRAHENQDTFGQEPTSEKKSNIASADIRDLSSYFLDQARGVIEGPTFIFHAFMHDVLNILIHMKRKTSDIKANGAVSVEDQSTSDYLADVHEIIKTISILPTTIHTKKSEEASGSWLPAKGWQFARYLQSNCHLSDNQIRKLRHDLALPLQAISSALEFYDISEKLFSKICDRAVVECEKLCHFFLDPANSIILQQALLSDKPPSQS